jgi:hypothetical protein
LVLSCPVFVSLVSFLSFLRTLDPHSAPTPTFTFPFDLDDDIHVLFAKEVDCSASDVFEIGASGGDDVDYA